MRELIGMSFLSSSVRCSLSMHSLLATKSGNFDQIKAATDTILNVLNEVSSHKAYCASLGITEAELLATPESPATTAYGAYILDCGLSGKSYISLTMRLLMAVQATERDF